MKLQIMIEIAMLAAIAFVIDLLIPSIKPIPSVYLNFSMIPIFILAFRRGVIAAGIAGLIWGLLQIVTAEASLYHPVQVILEYIFALMFISVAGLFRGKIQNHFVNGFHTKAISWAVVAIILGSLARYVFHFIAGFVFWTKLLGMSTGAGIIFSLWTNALSAIGSGILCALIVVLLLRSGSRLVTQTAK